MATSNASTVDKLLNRWRKAMNTLENATVRAATVLQASGKETIRPIKSGKKKTQRRHGKELKCID